MIAEATHPWLTARPPPLRPPKRTELLLARALGTLKPLLSRGYSPGGSRGEARRLSRELGSWLSPPGHGRRSPGAAPAAPWREERGRLPPAPAGRSGQGQRAGAAGRARGAAKRQGAGAQPLCPALMQPEPLQAHLGWCWPLRDLALSALLVG